MWKKILITFPEQTSDILTVSFVQLTKTQRLVIYDSKWQRNLFFFLAWKSIELIKLLLK